MKNCGDKYKGSKTHGQLKKEKTEYNYKDYQVWERSEKGREERDTK